MAKRQPVSAITALPASPEEDRHARMVRYVIAMSVRVACLVTCFFVVGTWWLLVFALGAIVLPYLAVVLANVSARPGGVVMRPGGLVTTRQQPLVPDDPRDDAAAGSDGRDPSGAPTDDARRHS